MSQRVRLPQMAVGRMKRLVERLKSKRMTATEAVIRDRLMKDLSWFRRRNFTPRKLQQAKRHV